MWHIYIRGNIHIKVLLQLTIVVVVVLLLVTYNCQLESRAPFSRLFSNWGFLHFSVSQLLIYEKYSPVLGEHTFWSRKEEEKNVFHSVCPKKPWMVVSFVSQSNWTQLFPVVVACETERFTCGGPQKKWEKWIKVRGTVSACGKAQQSMSN